MMNSSSKKKQNVVIYKNGKKTLKQIKKKKIALISNIKGKSELIKSSLQQFNKIEENQYQWIIFDA